MRLGLSYVILCLAHSPLVTTEVLDIMSETGRI